MVVSSPETAGFIGNDAISDQDNAILVAFTGQVPVKITGSVNAGDYLVPNSDGTAHGVAPASATLADYVSKVAVAVESSTGGTVKGLVSGPGASAEFNPQATSTFADLNITGTLTVNNLTVTGVATFQGNIIVGGHIITQGNTPTATINSAAGAGAICTVSGNDTAGQITITTGSGGWAAGEQCAISFANSYSSAPRPVITPANGTDTSNVKPFVDVPGGAPYTSWNLNFIGADTGQHTYKFNYFNVQ